MTALAKLGPRAVHVAVDVQRMFLEPTRWHVAGLPGILPNIATLARARATRTLFTRFVPPLRASDAIGRWRRYYDHWGEFTGERLAADMIDVVPALATEAARAAIVDKPTYSAFEAEEFCGRLAALDAEAVIFSGVETDVCVLATLLGAVDRGLRAIAVSDALASGSATAHEAVLRTLLPRLGQQVEIASTADVLAAWSDG